MLRIIVSICFGQSMRALLRHWGSPAPATHPRPPVPGQPSSDTHPRPLVPGPWHHGPRPSTPKSIGIFQSNHRLLVPEIILICTSLLLLNITMLIAFESVRKSFQTLQEILLGQGWHSIRAKEAEYDLLNKPQLRTHAPPQSK